MNHAVTKIYLGYLHNDLAAVDLLLSEFPMWTNASE